MSGDNKALADINGDGQLDLIVGGTRLVWYQYPSWRRHLIATSQVQFTTDMQAGDVDSDGDQDLILADGDAGSNLLWFENTGSGSSWTKRVIGETQDYVHDLEIGDFDGDGKLDVATHKSPTHIFFQNSKTSWTRKNLSAVVSSGDGFGSGDVDQDGDPDLIGNGEWYENPGQRSGTWIARTIANAARRVDTGKTSIVVDVNGDGMNDVAFIPQHERGKFAWYENPTPLSGTWTEHIINSSSGSHKLNAGDMDGDGDIDFVIGLELTELAVFYNLNGAATSWSKQLLSENGLHNARVGDIGADGDLDIFGSNYIDNPPTELWENTRISASPTPTPTPFPAACHIALNQPVTAAPRISRSRAANAVDGTRAAWTIQQLPATFEIDLGADTTINKAAFDFAAAARYQLTVSGKPALAPSYSRLFRYRASRSARRIAQDFETASLRYIRIRVAAAGPADLIRPKLKEAIVTTPECGSISFSYPIAAD